jgi:hypothetical protein
LFKSYQHWKSVIGNFPGNFDSGLLALAPWEVQFLYIFKTAGKTTFPLAKMQRKAILVIIVLSPWVMQKGCFYAFKINIEVVILSLVPWVMQQQIALFLFIDVMHKEPRQVKLLWYSSP